MINSAGSSPDSMHSVSRMLPSDKDSRSKDSREVPTWYPRNSSRQRWLENGGTIWKEFRELLVAATQRHFQISLHTKGIFRRQKWQTMERSAIKSPERSGLIIPIEITQRAGKSVYGALSIHGNPAPLPQASWAVGWAAQESIGQPHFSVV
jgi:hypothetical protein